MLPTTTRMHAVPPGIPPQKQTHRHMPLHPKTHSHMHTAQSLITPPPHPGPSVTCRSGNLYSRRPSSSTNGSPLNRMRAGSTNDSSSYFSEPGGKRPLRRLQCQGAGALCQKAYISSFLVQTHCEAFLTSEIDTRTRKSPCRACTEAATGRRSCSCR